MFVFACLDANTEFVNLTNLVVHQIPLAKKLKECGVFGVASDEYLNYAQKNRQEWEIRGAEIVASMVEKVSGN